MNKQVTVKIVLDTRYVKETLETIPVIQKIKQLNPKDADYKIKRQKLFQLLPVTFPAKLRVTYLKKQNYYSTKHDFTQKAWEKMTGIRPGQLKDTLIELQDIEKKAVKIIEKIPVFSFEVFKKRFLNLTDNNTIAGSFTHRISELRNNGQIGNAINYECAVKSFEKFLAGALLSDVTVDFLNKYEIWMKEQSRSTTTMSMYLRSLRCIINKAITEGEFQRELYPFGRYKYEIPESRNIKKALSESEISAIINYDCSGATEKARDFWYFIYLCGGINVQDACLLKYSDIKRNKIEYERSKTAKTKKKKSKIIIFITDEIKGIITKYGQGGEGYIFPVLNEAKTPERKKDLIQYFTHWINDHVKEIAKKLKIDIPVTTYVARHSYASQLLRSGISISAISKKMHDGNIKTTMNYLSDLTDDQEIEMAKALVSFKNKPQAKVVNL